MENKLKVLFHLKRSENNSDGVCPILGRITVGVTTAQFRTKLMTDPSKWDTRAGRLAGKGYEAVKINERLKRINALIFLRYGELFSLSEVGLNKAVCLATRINRFFGSAWEAIPERYDLKKHGTANIFITCVDNIRGLVHQFHSR